MRPWRDAAVGGSAAKRDLLPEDSSIPLGQRQGLPFHGSVKGADTGLHPRHQAAVQVGQREQADAAAAGIGQNCSYKTSPGNFYMFLQNKDGRVGAVQNPQIPFPRVPAVIARGGERPDSCRKGPVIQGNVDGEREGSAV